jgi:hypothetical protein
LGLRLAEACTKAKQHRQDWEFNFYRHAMFLSAIREIEICKQG